MKFVHLSDLHLGKRVYEYSMLEEQEDILNKILKIIDAEKPDGVLLAGDIYDKPVPPAEAVALFDSFLVQLTKRGLQVFCISGNHDSAERLSFGAEIMNTAGVHFSKSYNGQIAKVELSDGYGPFNVYLLPFLKPVQVRRAFLGEPDAAELDTYNKAVAYALSKIKLNAGQRNLLVTHQFVAGAARCESEEIFVGGSDCVDVSLFLKFDYVALGHLHTPQSCGRPTVRYCGTPLKYSFSEVRDEKSVTVVELLEKGNVSVKTVALTPKHDLLELKGTYEQLMLKSFYQNSPYQNAYTHLTLTNEEDIPGAAAKLRTVYHRLMKLDYDNRRTRASAEISGADPVSSKSPFELFEQLYELQNNQPMSREQSRYAQNLINQIWGQQE